MESRLGILLCAFAAILWAVSATVARTLMDRGASPLELAEARAFVAAAAFWIISSRLTERPRAPTSHGRAVVVLLGASLAGVNLTYFLAIGRLPVAIAIVIQYTAPAIVVLYELVVVRRKPTPVIVVALLAVLFGVALVGDAYGAWQGTRSLDGLGLLFAFASAFGFAAYNLLAARAEPRYGTVRAHAIAFTVASGIWIALPAPRGMPSTLFDPSFIPGLAVVTLLGTVAAFGIYAAGIRRVGPSPATIASTLEPVAVAVLGVVVLGQALSLTQIIGAAMILGAVVSLRPRTVSVAPPAEVAHDPRGL